MDSIFKYRARNTAGKFVNGKINAPHKGTAIYLLRARKLFVMEIKEVPGSSELYKECKPWLTGGRVDLKDISLFCRQFAAMTGAGVSIMQSLHVLCKQTSNKSLANAIQSLIADLESGRSMSEAMAKCPKVFPEIFVTMVKAGEVSGSLDQVLDRLADYLEKNHEHREKIKSAITYPITILLFSILVMVVLLIFILPAFAQVLTGLNAPIPAATALLLGTGEWLQSYWFLFPPLGIFLVYIYKALSANPGGKKFIDKVILTLPLFGGLIKREYILRFCRTMAILLRSGVPLLYSLDLVKHMTVNSVIIQAITRAEESIKGGHGLADPLRSSQIFPPMVIKMIEVGEETGSLEALLDKIALYYGQEIDQTVNRLSAALEPLLICFIGSIVGFILISILIPVFGVMNSFQ